MWHHSGTGDVFADGDLRSQLSANKDLMTFAPGVPNRENPRAPYLLGTSITFVVMVIDPVLGLNDTASVDVRHATVDLPTVQVRGPAVVHVRSTSGPLTMQASGQRPSCSGSGSLEFVWRLVSSTAAIKPELHPSTGPFEQEP